MFASSTDVKNRFGMYLEMAVGQDIIITRNGAAIAKLVGINAKEKSMSEQLRGIIPPDVDEEAIKAERMARI